MTESQVSWIPCVPVWTGKLGAPGWQTTHSKSGASKVWKRGMGERGAPCPIRLIECTRQLNRCYTLEKTERTKNDKRHKKGQRKADRNKFVLFILPCLIGCCIYVFLLFSEGMFHVPTSLFHVHVLYNIPNS